jgi:hypothetical protein
MNYYDGGTKLCIYEQNDMLSVTQNTLFLVKEIVVEGPTVALLKEAKIVSIKTNLEIGKCDLIVWYTNKIVPNENRYLELLY